MDVNSLVQMLSGCKQLTSFEVHGKLDENRLVTKVVGDSLRTIMQRQGVACRFKLLPKFITAFEEVPSFVRFQD